MKVLAIETSCDETAVAVVEDRTDGSIGVLSNVVYSQMEIHRRFGGVYPEAASREHVRKIGLVLEETLTQAVHKRREYFGSVRSEHSESEDSCEVKEERETFRRFIRQEIDLIAVTAGPGLIGSLLVGVNAAKTLAYAFNKPLVGINHHEGHIAAVWLAPSGEISNNQFPISNQITNFQTPKFPVIALVVSGGHTQLVLMPAIGQFEVIGKTRDDAAGEAFDKVARLLGLSYPGGPAIAAAAATYTLHPTPYTLPRPMLDADNFDFSFSGLKTAVAQLVAKHLRGGLSAGMAGTPVSSEVREPPGALAKWPKRPPAGEAGSGGLFGSEVGGAKPHSIRAAIAYEFQEAVVEVLVTKTLRAVNQFHPKSVILCGGVAANQRLRESLIRNCQQLTVNCQLFIPPRGMCTDNAAMIGAAALIRARIGPVGTWRSVTADDRLTLSPQPPLTSRNLH